MGSASGTNGIADMITEMRDSEIYGHGPDWVARPWHEQCLADFRLRFNASNKRPFAYHVGAGVGSGKTAMAVLIASLLLKRGACRKFIYVAPGFQVYGGKDSDKGARAEFRAANIEMVPWIPRVHGHGIPVQHDGVFVTYSGMIKHAEALGRLCEKQSTLVIFDEIHHLGDSQGWADKARTAFEKRATVILGLSGTLFRSDNLVIPFVDYEVDTENSLRVFKPDFCYPLGRAIVDGYCRRPVTFWTDAEVVVKTKEGPTRYTMSEILKADGLPDKIRNRVLKGAVRPGTESRAHIVRMAVSRAKDSGRRLIIFVGGDSQRLDGGGIKDATELLPAELRRHGIPSDAICVVTGDDRSSRDKIRGFAKSKAWILINVNMVSEGVDIPVLSSALFLTSITAVSTTVQRIGRVLRGSGEAHIDMFLDSRLHQIIHSIETERKYEIALAEATGRPIEEGLGINPNKEHEPSSYGVTARDAGMTTNGKDFEQAILERYKQLVIERGWTRSDTHYHIISPLIKEGMFGPVPGFDGRAVR